MPPLNGQQVGNVMPFINISEHILVNVATLLASAIAYGVQITLQGICIVILRRPVSGENPASKARMLLLIATLMMTVSSTVSLTFNAISCILDGRRISNLQDIYVQNDFNENDSFVSSVNTKFFNMLIGDAVVFWRAWVLWRDKRRSVYIGIPGILLLCTAVGVGLILIFTSLTARTGHLHTEDLNNTLLFITFGLSTITNITTNISIGYYTWLHRKAVRRYLDGGYQSVRSERLLMVVLESGIFYTMMLIFGGIFSCISYSLMSKSFIWALLGMLADTMGSSFVSIYPSLFIVLVFFQQSIWDSVGNMVDAQGAI